MQGMVGALGAWTPRVVTILEPGTTCQAPYLLVKAIRSFGQ